MGGRRSKTIRKIFGTDPSLISPKIRLTKAIKKKESSEKIASYTVDLVSMSKISSNDLAKATKFIEFISKKIDKENLSLNLKEGKKLASELWTEAKRKDKIDISKEMDEIIVSSVADVLRGRKNEK